MSNQWGRDGNRTGGRGGAGGILFAAFICLLIGGGAGYGVFRMMDGGASSDAMAVELSLRDDRLKALARELDVAANRTTDQGREIERLEDANTALRRQVDSLRESLNTNDRNTTDTAAQADDEQLRQIETQMRGAEQRVADAEALRERAQESVRQLERRLSLQADELSRARQEINRLSTDATAQQNADIARLEGEVATLRNELDRARASERQAVDVQIPTLRSELEMRQQEYKALEQSNRALSRRIASLEREAREDETPQNGAVTPALDNAEPSDARSPRSAALVERAMDVTPGLAGLSAAERERLKQTLVAGDCVTNALGSVFQRVPILALRNLMRDLDSDC